METTKYTFLEFMNDMHGYDIYTKETNRRVYRYQLFWSGMRPWEVKKKYNCIKRPIVLY